MLYFSSNEDFFSFFRKKGLREFSFFPCIHNANWILRTKFFCKKHILPQCDRPFLTFWSKNQLQCGLKKANYSFLLWSGWEFKTVWLSFTQEHSNMQRILYLGCCKAQLYQHSKREPANEPATQITRIGHAYVWQVALQGQTRAFGDSCFLISSVF